MQFAKTPLTHWISQGIDEVPTSSSSSSLPRALPYWLVDFNEHGMSIQAGPVFERRVQTIFLTLSGIRGPDSTFRLLRKDITGYTSSANQEDTSIGTSGSELTEPKIPKARRREKPEERREKSDHFSDSLSASSVLVNLRRYEFLVRFSFSLK